MLQGARDDVLLPALDKAIARLRELAHEHAGLPMMSRTHGQPATPTTLGKEMANVVYRLERAAPRIAAVSCSARSTARSATTTPTWRRIRKYDWEGFAKRFVESLGLNSTPTPSRSSRTTRWPNCSMPSPAPTPS
jgi:adenylosuccinate lyase